MLRNDAHVQPRCLTHSAFNDKIRAVRPVFSRKHGLRLKVRLLCAPLLLCLSAPACVDRRVTKDGRRFEGIGQVTSFAAAPAVASRSAVLFAFDDVSIPATRGLEVRMLHPEKHPANPILSRGVPGEADAGSAQGVSVVREENRWRLWYSAHDEAGQPRMAYAESRDGLHWEKPRLGLVTFNGTSANNLVAAEAGVEARSVLLDPERPPE